MTRGWEASVLWLGAAATAAALYPYSRTGDCGHWHDGSFLVLAATASAFAGGGTYRLLFKRSVPAAIVLAIASSALVAVVALLIAYASAASTCSR